MPLEAGECLGPYEVIAPLGVGAMGEVYRAVDTRLERQVALKVLPEDLRAEPERRARFEREARVLSRLEDPRVCRLYDVGSADDRDFLVMELLEGESLRDRLARGPLGHYEAIRIGQQIAQGLAAVHRQGLTHRDLKPANIMLTASGVKLVDFGLARMEPPAAHPEITSSGQVVGTYRYMSPEQARGEKAGPASDLFSLGVLLYELLSGERPFKANGHAEMISALLRDEPQPLESHRADLPPRLAEAVHRCLAKKPKDRFASALEVSRILEAEASSVDGTTLISGDRPAPDQAAHRRRLRWAAAAIVLGALLAFGWFLTARQNSSSEPGWSPSTPPLQIGRRVGYYGNPTLDPSGRLIAYEFYDGTGPLEDLRLFLYDRQTGSERQVLDWSSYQGTPAFSPEGRRLAFSSTGPDNSATASLWTTDLESGATQRWTTTPAFFPAWSPDGREIAFSTGYFDPPWGLGRGSEIAVLDLGSGELRYLGALEGGAQQPAWSPNGNLIAYSAIDRDQTYHIRLIEADGSEDRALTDGPGRALTPAWGCGGECLYFLSTGESRGFRYSLVRMLIDPERGSALSEPEPVAIAGYVEDFDVDDVGDTLLYLERQQPSQPFLVEVLDDFEPVGSPESFMPAHAGLRVMDVQTSGTLAVYRETHDAPYRAQTGLVDLGSGSAELITKADVEVLPQTFSADDSKVLVLTRPIENGGVAQPRQTAWLDISSHDLEPIEGSEDMLWVHASFDRRYLSGSLQSTTDKQSLLLDTWSDSTEPVAPFPNLGPVRIRAWSPTDYRVLLQAGTYSELLICSVDDQECSEPFEWPHDPNGDWFEPHRILFSRHGGLMVWDAQAGAPAVEVESPLITVGSRYSHALQALVFTETWERSTLWETRAPN